MIIPIWKYVSLARADDALSDKAWDITADLLRQKKSENFIRDGLRGSDAGSCTNELRCKLAGEDMLPDDPRSMMFRLDAGSLIGARLQALFKVGFEADDKNLGFDVELEAESEYLGVKSHADIAVFDDREVENEEESGYTYVFSADIKTSYFPGKPRNPNSPESPKDDHQEYVLQAAHQALGLGCEDFGVFSVAMADGNYRGEAPVYCLQSDFKASEWKEKVVSEYSRLMLAGINGEELQRLDGPGPCDYPPHQTWRPRFCHNPHCPKRAPKTIEELGIAL